jgi:ATP-binding cassette, subfamily B, bacterial PglK
MNLAYFREIIALMGKFSNRLPIVLIFGVILGIIDILGLGLVAQFVGAILGGSENNIPQLSYLSGISASGHFTGALLVLIFLMRACLGISSYWYINNISGKIEANLKSELLLHYQQMPYEDRIKRGEAELVNAINLWATQYGRFVLIPLARFISDSLIGLMILIFLAYASFISLLTFCGLIGFVALIYDLTLKKRGQTYAKIFRSMSTQVVSDVQQGLEGYKEIHAFELEDFFQKRIRTSTDRMCSALAKANTISQSPRFIIEAVVVLFVVVSLYMSRHSPSQTTALLPVLAMFAVGGIRIVGLATLASSIVFNLRLYRPIVKQLAADHAKSSINYHRDTVTKKNIKFEKLEVSDLTFAYRASFHPILNNVSFACTAGENLAIVGSSGCGKTTLVDLLLGIIQPGTGSIQVICEGGDNRSNLVGIATYLSQTTFLLNDSLRRNIALGSEDADIDDARVIAALNKAKLMPFTANLDMLLGDRGGKISGGQRQRVALARAFYLNRNVLILDEATNALDLQTETEIIKDLLALRNEITLIVVTHRPEIAKLFSRRLIFSEGKLTHSSSEEKLAYSS